jgi:hypothetical protein
MSKQREEKTVKRTERGWAGHFCASRSCLYRRNTLLECGDRRVVVSTVGNYQPQHKFFNPGDKRENEIGINRFYETMVFEAMKDGAYWEADVTKEVPFDSDWTIDELEQETDIKADEMHEKVVEEIIKKLK